MRKSRKQNNKWYIDDKLGEHVAIETELEKKVLVTRLENHRMIRQKGWRSLNTAIFISQTVFLTSGITVVPLPHRRTSGQNRQQNKRRGEMERLCDALVNTKNLF